MAAIHVEMQPANLQRLRELESRMRAELPATLQRLRALQHKLATAHEAAEAGLARRDLTMAAHRLRGRAGMLRLQALCAAAADLEQHAEAGANQQALARDLEECGRALQQESGA